MIEWIQLSNERPSTPVLVPVGVYRAVFNRLRRVALLGKWQTTSFAAISTGQVRRISGFWISFGSKINEMDHKKPTWHVRTISLFRWPFPHSFSFHSSVPKLVSQKKLGRFLNAIAPLRRSSGTQSKLSSPKKVRFPQQFAFPFFSVLLCLSLSSPVSHCLSRSCCLSFLQRFHNCFSLFWLG